MAVLLVSSSTAAGASSVAYLSSGGVTEIWGAFDAGQPDGAVLGMLDGSAAGPVLSAPSMHVQVITHSLELDTHRYSTSARDVDLEGGELRLLGAAAYRLISDGPITASSEGLPGSALLAPITPQDPTRLYISQDDLRLGPGASYTGFTPLAGSVDTLGNLSLWVVEGRIAASGSGLDVPAAGGAYVHRGSLVENLVSGREPTHYEYTVLLVTAPSARYAFAAEEASASQNVLLSDESSPLTVRVEGTVIFRDAEGVAVVGDEANAVEEEELVVTGSLLVEPSGSLVDANNPGSRRTEYTVTGDVSGLKVGEGPAREYTTVALGGAAALLVAALGWAWPVVRFHLSQVPGLLLYAKVEKGEVLENGTRGEIYEYIRSNPGVNVGSIDRHFPNGWGTIVYHLTVLERNHYVTSVRDGRHKRFFPVGLLDHSELDRAALLANPTAARIHALIRERPGIIQVALAEAMGISPPAVHWHVHRLIAAGLVEQVRDGRRILYVPASEAGT